MKNSDVLLKDLRDGKELSRRVQLMLILKLSIPAILAQISSIVMQYIDASMVGRLGTNESASIGLVASSTWLMGGLCSAFGIGFTVQMAQRIGARDDEAARRIMRQGLVLALIFSSVLLCIAVAISGGLPRWLGGGKKILTNASHYFMIYGISLPILQINSISGSMLQSSGNMKTPSILHILMCLLDVVFNYFFIFSESKFSIGGFVFSIPGLGLGVMGAALGTALAQLVTMSLMLYFLLVCSPTLHLRHGEKLRFVKADIIAAGKLSLPVAFEQIVMCGAYIMSTRIVAPLGTIAIAANSFSVTAESLCYMPGYGVAHAATTLIGQSVGAKRGKLSKHLAWLSTVCGMLMMAFSGAVMYFLAPWMIGVLSPDLKIRELGTRVLRLEVFAEPMYAASIVASGALRGAGDTLIPSALNFFSMWAVRLPLSAFLATRYGLFGVWMAMCIELWVRGILFLIRLATKKWTE